MPYRASRRILGYNVMAFLSQVLTRYHEAKPTNVD